MIASTRMYNVAPGATAAWHRLLACVVVRSGVAMDMVDHPHPATLRDLWDRPDLGCAFMCGWPLARETGVRAVIAAPVPVEEDGPAYHSVLVVAAGSAFRRVEDTFGGRFAFNARESHSGWNMPRAYLAGLGASYAAEVGPFGPHQRAAAAVAEGEADVAALDSLVWALLGRHDPGLARRLRVVGRTPSQPSPPLVGAATSPTVMPGLDPGIHAVPPHTAVTVGTGSLVQGTRASATAIAWIPGSSPRMTVGETVLSLHQDAEGRALLADVCLSRFAPASQADYAVTRTLEVA